MVTTDNNHGSKLDILNMMILQVHCVALLFSSPVFCCTLFNSSLFTFSLSLHPLLCPLFSSWSSDGQYCRVVKESGNYVECACSHLSIYMAYAEFATLASYNDAFYASGFICISGTKHALPVFSFSCCFMSCAHGQFAFLFSFVSDAFCPCSSHIVINSHCWLTWVIC